MSNQVATFRSDRAYGFQTNGFTQRIRGVVKWAVDGRQVRARLGMETQPKAFFIRGSTRGRRRKGRPDPFEAGQGLLAVGTRLFVKGLDDSLHPSDESIVFGRRRRERVSP
jgi:hypothetical protein